MLRPVIFASITFLTTVLLCKASDNPLNGGEDTIASLSANDALVKELLASNRTFKANWINNGSKILVPHEKGGTFLEETEEIEMFPTEAKPLFSCACFDEFDDTCNGATTCETNEKCFSSIKKDDRNKVVLQKGCFADHNSATLMCKINLKSRILVKCCEGDLCNDNLNPQLDVPAVKDENSSNAVQIFLAIFVPVVVFIIITGFLVHIRRLKHRKTMEDLEYQRKIGRLEGGLRAAHVGDSTLADLLTNATSGSGSGLPFLVQRTVARQIDLMECIGKGRYGEVWRGEFQGESVAVKIFSSRDEASWARETEIYNTVMLRHNNILGYIASDMTSRNSCTQLWLVCYYYKYGSLYDFLQKTTLDTALMLQLCSSAANGLTHLHTEISGVRGNGKAAIAHRDVKSKNILVKNNLTCCIADLGLAVIHMPSDNLININKNNRVGTKRYMPPEVLNETINTFSFDGFKQADVYSFSLVLWEIARRCVIEGIAEEYQPPFYDVVGHDPSFDEMKKVICIDEYRPVIPNRWSEDETMVILSKLIKEMWTGNPSSRLPMLRVKKTLFKLIDQLKDYEVNDAKSDFNDFQPLLISDKSYDTKYAQNLL